MTTTSIDDASNDAPPQYDNHSLRRRRRRRNDNRGMRAEEERHSRPPTGEEEGAYDEGEEGLGWRRRVTSIATISEGRHVAVVGIDLDEYDDDYIYDYYDYDDESYASRIVDEIRAGLMADDGVVLVEEVRACARSRAW